ncbi:hypothetical protein JOC93_002135 [Priestia taiwanensis]|nr:hypothetical protein [Priestia taiwanensis]
MFMDKLAKVLFGFCGVFVLVGIVYLLFLS